MSETARPNTPANAPKTEWMSVDILTFRHASRDIDFDVFLKLSEGNFAHVFSRATGLDYQRLAHYLAKGVKELFIRPEDEKAYLAFINKTSDSIFQDPETAPEKKVASLLNMTEQNMTEIFARFKVSPDAAHTTQRLIRNYVKQMAENPKMLAALLKLVSHGDYLYSHSIAVSVFSLFLAKASGQFNTRMMEMIGMGGFLHDIGSIKLPKEVVCSPTELRSEQWVEMHSHPKIGLDMIEGASSISDEVRYMVYQHHEEPGGQGYPNALRGPVIFYPAKLVAVADSFAALISRRPFRGAYTPDQAVHIMRNETGKYDKDLINLLASIFVKSERAAA